jgi:hypothetical protein
MKKFDIQIFLQFTSAFTIVQDSTNTLLTSEVGYRSTPKKQSAQNTVLTWHVRLFRSRARMCVVGFFRFVVMHAQEAGIRIDFFLRSAGQELSETVRVSAWGCSQLWPWLTTTSLARPCLPRRARCFSRRALQGSAAPFWGEYQPAAHVCHLRTSSAVNPFLAGACSCMRAAPRTQASGWRETLCWAYGQVSGTREGRCGLV